MKILLALVFSGAMAQASTAPEWNSCIQSYQNARSSIFDVANIGTSAENRLLFRNGRHSTGEGLSLYYKGQFWNAPMEIVDGFYSPRVAKLTVGADIFCLKFDLNWIRDDKFSMTPYRADRCASTENITMTLNNTIPEEVLRSRLKGDVELGMYCFEQILDPTRRNECSVGSREDDYSKLKRWNTAECEKLKDPVINKVIAKRNQVLSRYPAVRASWAAPAAAPAGSKVHTDN